MTHRFSPFRRQVLATGIASGLLATGLAAPAWAQTSTGAVLRVGHQKGWLSIIKARGTLEKRLAPLGVKVTWTEFNAGPVQLEALNVGSIDFGDVGEAPPIFAQAAGAPLVYAGATVPRPALEAVIVPSGSAIRSVADLKGKRVAYNKGSNVHYFLVRALEDAGLKYTDVQTVFLPPADARAAFERGSVDAWVIWDPYQAAAEQQLHARTLRDASGIADNHQFYLATKPYAEQHPKVIETLVDEVRTIGEWAKAHPEDVTKQVAPLLGLSPEITLTAVKRQGYGAQFLTPEVVNAQQKIADSFYQLKLIPKPLVVKDVIWTPPANLAKAN